MVEILSPEAANAQRDRRVKRQLYSKFGVREYWIVDPERKEVEIYKEGALRLAATLAEDNESTSLLLPEFGCTARDIFARRSFVLKRPPSIATS